MTEALIVCNLLVYLAGLVTEFAGVFSREALVGFGALSRSDFMVWKLVSYQFLHDPGDILHLAFNLLFLWVFGSAVEDRLGRFGYAGFYLIGGAVAGIAHMMISPAAVIGASGAIASVTGAFLALFPRSRISVLVFFFVIGIYHVPSVWFIGFYFIIDLLRQTGSLLGGGGDNVAYMAHIAGYLYGFSLAFVLLTLRIIKREEFDVFYLFKQSRRRAAFRAAGRHHAAGLWESASADTGERLAKRAPFSRVPDAHEQRVADLRAEVNQMASSGNLSVAAQKYRELLRVAPDAAFSESRQLELANQLCAEHDHPHAAAAYELLLTQHPKCGNAAEIRLMLGVLYARQLNQPEKARDAIHTAKTGLHDPHQAALADELLAELSP